jgi:hypothetical protein
MVLLLSGGTVPEILSLRVCGYRSSAFSSFSIFGFGYKNTKPPEKGLFKGL